MSKLYHVEERGAIREIGGGHFTELTLTRNGTKFKLDVAHKKSAIIPENLWLSDLEVRGQYAHFTDGEDKFYSPLKIEAPKLEAKVGVKDDSELPRMSLLFSGFATQMLSIARVLTFGAKKYPKPPLDDNWKDVPDGKRRYTDAMYRHMNKIHANEAIDKDSGESHYACVIVNALFLWELSLSEGKKNGKTDVTDQLVQEQAINLLAGRSREL